MRRDYTDDGTPRVPTPAEWSSDWTDEPAIVVAGEARVATVGEDDWNRG